MKLLVTGGAGFIGSNLVDELIEDHEVVVVDNLSTGTIDNVNKRAKFYKVDICSKELEEVFKKEKPEAIFHLAAQINVRSSVNNPINDATINILGSLNLLELARKYDVNKIIFSSTGGAIYGDTQIIPTPESIEANPMNPYGCAKLSVEKYLYYYFRVYGIKYIALRYSNVYGPRQNPKAEAGVIAIFISKMLNGENPKIFGDGNQTRDFIYVKDVVYANKLALNKNKVGSFNISTGKETTINELFDTINKFFNNRFNKIHLPPIPGEQKRSCLDYTKAKKELDWKPTTNLNEGIKLTIDFFKTFK